MIESAITLAGSILYLASAIGALAIIGLMILPGLYSGWKEAKHQIDIESEAYISIVDALEKAEGRPIQIVIVEDEK
jgi:hypothetical protein